MFNSLNIPGLILDLAIIAVILISAVNGTTKGFFRTFISFIGWLISVIAPFFLTVPFRTWLIEKTNMDESISAHIAVNIKESFLDIGKIAQLTPLNEEVQSVEESSAQIISDSISTIIMTIIAFFILFITLKIATRILIHLIPEKRGRAAVSRIDGFFGFLLGSLRGLLFVLIVLMTAFPLFSLLGSDFSTPAISCIRQSHIANALYFNNPIINILNSL